MGLLGRLFEKLDANLHVEIPEQRSVSPDEVVRHLTPRGQQFRILDIYSHCRCCNAYDPQPCPVIHRAPCDRSECCELDGAS